MDTKKCIQCGKIFHKLGKYSWKQWEGQKLCSKECSSIYVGKKRKGLPTWNKGKKTGLIPKTAFKKGEKSNEKHHLWKGDNVGYQALHTWIRRHYGAPDTCEHCRETGLTGYKINWANKSSEYKRERDDWLRLCVPCHKLYDSDNLRSSIG